MNESTITRPPTWFWVVAILALIWNLLGLMPFAMHMLIRSQGLNPHLPRPSRWPVRVLHRSCRHGKISCFKLCQLAET